MSADGAVRGLPIDEARRMLHAIPLRRSRRSYTGQPVPPEALAELSALARAWNPWPEARCVVVDKAPPSLFLGIVGSYAGISGSPSAIVFVGSDKSRQEAVGYTGEGLVLAATARGLDTCWVAGVFRAASVAELADLRAGERVVAVSALGQASAEETVKEKIIYGASHTRPRRTTEELAPSHERWPAWAQRVVETARVAPSARNVQPWRFVLDDDGLRVSFAGRELPGPSKRLDCGIAMLHIELAALAEGVTGEWRHLPSPDVAVFVPHGA